MQSETSINKNNGNITKQFQTPMKEIPNTETTTDKLGAIPFRGPTKKELLSGLFMPDFEEIFLFVISVILSIGIIHIFSIPIFVEISNFPLLIVTITLHQFINPAILFLVGFIAFLFYAYRWGYSSLQQASERRKKMMKKHETENRMFVIDIKFFGFALSLLICGIFYILRDYAIWFILE